MNCHEMNNDDANWHEINNDDSGSIYTGDMRLSEGDLIQVEGELNPRRVSYVMGSKVKGWRACTKGCGAFPYGSVRWQLLTGDDTSRPIRPATHVSKSVNVGGVNSSPPPVSDTRLRHDFDSASIGYDSAWTWHNTGAVAAIVESINRERTLIAPAPLRFEGAPAAIANLVPSARVRVLAIDQPTIVRNMASYRPVELAVAGVINAIGGAVQPAYRGRQGMFDDGAPIWTFLSELSFLEAPDEIKPRNGDYVIEVYPCLNILGLVPEFRARNRCAKYNPDRSTFSESDWQLLCRYLVHYGTSHCIAGLPEWAEGWGKLARPLKRDQDKLDAVISAVVAFEWLHGGLATPHGLMIGDTTSGYMITPSTEELSVALLAKARKRSVPVLRLW